MEISNLSDGEFKTLVVRTLKELIEYGKKVREEMKATLSEIKIYREPIVERMILRIKSMIWNTRKEKAFNQNSRKKK